MFHTKVEEKSDVIIIHIEGDFYIEYIDRVEYLWNEQVAKKPKIIAIDCGEIKYIDSTAIGSLVKFLNDAMSKQIRLIMYDLSCPIQKLFEAARLKKHFTLTTKKQFEKQIRPSIQSQHLIDAYFTAKIEMQT